MTLKSFIFDGAELVPISVELTLWTGIPGIQFLGLPDQHLKESAHRIKSALKNQGFLFPKAQQILVNLRPSHIKKTSRGLELAVAMAYLFESGQIKVPEELDQTYFYGELSLQGEVFEPQDSFLAPLKKKEIFFTGPSGSEACSQGLERNFYPFRRKTMDQLKNFETLQTKAAEEKFEFQFRRPSEFQNLEFSEKDAQMITLISCGEHSTLFAGPAGSGKSTQAQVVHSLLEEPQPAWILDWQKKGKIPDFRPLQKPHHTTPVMALLGGGNQFFRGEISKAHGGALLLDEFLEFNPMVLEALREPIEERKMIISRKGQTRSEKTDFLILATSNLCPCGDYLPGSFQNTRCSYNLQRCSSTLRKLSGPLLDRFEVLSFVKRNASTKVGWGEIFENVQKGIRFRKEKRKQNFSNSRISSLELVAWAKRPEISVLIPTYLSSQRRINALLKVARTHADLEESLEIKPVHINRALELTVHRFDQLRQMI